MDAPDYPDPKDTATAQSQANQGTAISQQLLNQTNQVTPDGSLTYTQTGTNSYTDPLTGKQVTLPQYTATQTYSPQNQAIYNTNQQTKQNVANIGQQQSSKIGELLNTPVDLSNNAVEGRLMELGSKRLDPLFNQRKTSMETDLLNRGVTAGSEAYNNAMNLFGQQQNDAYNQLLLNGRQQAVTEQLAQRNQPINELSALLSGSQVSTPNFASTPTTQVGGVDYTGLVNNKFNAENQAYQSKMGGLFGLAAAPFSMFSF